MSGVGTIGFYRLGAARMNALSDRAETLQTQIATGKALTAASEDSAGWQRLQGLNRANANDAAFASNVKLAQAVLQQTDSTLGEITRQLQRAQELTIQANSDTLSATDRSAIAGQLDAIVADLAALADTRDARGLPLFDDGAAAIPIGAGQSVQAGETRDRAFGDIAGAIAGFARVLRDGTGVAGGAATALDSLAAAATAVSATRASVGARAARVDLVATRLTDAAADNAVARGAIEDTDVTAAIAELQQTMTILEATQASFTKLSQLSLFDYLR